MKTIFFTWNSVVLEKKFCTTHAIMRNIEKAIDNNNSFGVFIDLQKAFDTVDHNILFEKLLQSGIRGAAN